MPRDKKRPIRKPKDGKKTAGRGEGWGTVHKRTRRGISKFYPAYPDPRYKGTGRAPEVTSGNGYPNESQARAWLAGEHRKILDGTWEHPGEKAEREARERRAAEEAAVTLRQWSEQWLREGVAGVGREKPWKANTVRTFTSTLELHVLPFLGEETVQGLTPKRVREWHAGLTVEHGRSQSTCKKAYDTLRAMVNAAVEAELIEVSPVHVKGAAKKEPTKLSDIEPATPEQVQGMVDLAVPFIGVAIILAAECGLRYGEIAALTRADLVLTGSHPRVKVSKAVGKPGQGTIKLEDSPKSDAGNREIPIPHHRLPWLRAYVTEHVGATPTSLVMHAPTAAPGSFVTNDKLHKGKHRYDEVRDAVGLPKEFTFHALRHTYLSEMSYLNPSAIDLAALAGHASTQVTEIYLHSSRDRQEALVAAFSDRRAVESSTVTEIPVARAQ